MSNQIFKELSDLGLTSEKTRTLFSAGTRDVAGLNVWRDDNSGVIYIDDYYTGDATYISGAYRDETTANTPFRQTDLEATKDAHRRHKATIQFVTGKRVADFGCGGGDFLKIIQPHCKEVVGVELQQSYIDTLNSIGIRCTNSLDSIEEASLDTIVSFHVLEHLPNPTKVLKQLTRKIQPKSQGNIIIEVPHANDFLLSTARNESFKRFTLWSQHLILHTRESLRRLLEHAGLAKVHIQGVQRYPLSNHLSWLAYQKPAGHKSLLSTIDNHVLHDAYERSLARLDATDTLIAFAEVP